MRTPTITPLMLLAFVLLAQPATSVADTPALPDESTYVEVVTFPITLIGDGEWVESNITPTAATNLWLNLTLQSGADVSLGELELYNGVTLVPITWLAANRTSWSLESQANVWYSSTNVSAEGAYGIVNLVDGHPGTVNNNFIVAGGGSSLDIWAAWDSTETITRVRVGTGANRNNVELLRFCLRDANAAPVGAGLCQQAAEPPQNTTVYENNTYVNNTIYQNETTYVNTTIENTTWVNTTIVNVTYVNESQTNATNVTFENVTYIETTVENTTYLNQTYPSWQNATYLNETHENRTVVLENTTWLNTTELNQTVLYENVSLANVTYQNATTEQLYTVNVTNATNLTVNATDPALAAVLQGLLENLKAQNGTGSVVQGVESQGGSGALRGVFGSVTGLELGLLVLLALQAAAILLLIRRKAVHVEHLTIDRRATVPEKHVPEVEATYVPERRVGFSRPEPSFKELVEGGQGEKPAPPGEDLDMGELDELLKEVQYLQPALPPAKEG